MIYIRRLLSTVLLCVTGDARGAHVAGHVVYVLRQIPGAAFPWQHLHEARGG